MSLFQRIRDLRLDVRVALVILGLTLISIGVGMIFAPAGIIAGGLSAFVLEFRIDQDKGGRR